MATEVASHLNREDISPVDTPTSLTEYTYETVDTPQAVATAISSLISTDTEQLALVIISLTFEDDTTLPCEQARQPGYSAIYFLSNLRKLVRKTDMVFLQGHSFYFLLRGANLQGGQIVENRLWEALLWRIHHRSDTSIQFPRRMTIGHSACPAPSTDSETCMVAASKANFTFEVALGQFEGTVTKRQTEPLPSVSLKKETEIGRNLAALARKLGIPYLPLLPHKSLRWLQQLVRLELLHELHCYPLGRERNMLTVAMLNPEDRLAVERLQQETGLLIFPVLAHPEELQKALAQLS